MHSLDDYQQQTVLTDDEFALTFRATDKARQRDVVVTVFHDSLCQDARFRAALRRDAPLLLSLRHFHIVATHDWGESNGQMFLVTEVPEGLALSDSNNLVDGLEWDQITDVAWQLTSAVQHAHNLGLTHGNLSPKSVFVTPQIRVQVADFGVQSWKAAVIDKPADAATLRDADTHQLAPLFRRLMEFQPQNNNGSLLEGFRQLISKIETTGGNLSARDIQRRLGQLLLKDSDDEIEMIDQRSGISGSGRSLVDELFEPPIDEPVFDPSPVRPAKPTIWLEIICLVALTCLLILGIWLATR